VPLHVFSGQFHSNILLTENVKGEGREKVGVAVGQSEATGVADEAVVT